MPVETEFIDVDPRMIVIPESRVAAERNEDAEVTMDESVQRWGILQEPAVVEREGKLVLLYGEGRVQKAIEAGVDLMRVKLYHVGPAEAELIALTENLARGVVRPGKFVEKIRELVEVRGMQPAEISRLINRPARWVREIIEVSKLPTEVVEDVVTGDLSLEAARELARIHEVSQVLECHRLAIQGKWSAATLGQFIDRWVFKQCDMCHRGGAPLKKVGGELLCPECLRARYPMLADKIEHPEELPEETRKKMEAAGPAALVPEPKPVFPCNICAVGKPQEDLAQIVACRGCLEKLDYLMKKLEVERTMKFATITVQDLRKVTFTEA